MLQGKNKGGRNEQRASILNANTLDPYLDHPLQDFESLENSPQAIQEPLSTQDLNTDGILIMALKELFQKIKDPESEKQRVFIIRCSYFEIYNDAVYDLLNIQKELAFAEPLQLNEDIKVWVLLLFM